MKFAHKFGVGSRLKPTFENYSLTSKNLSGTSNLPQIIKDCCQSGEHNFEMAQHVHNQITDVSSTINMLQNGIKLGATGF